MILGLQASFHQQLQAAVAALKYSGAALWSLLALGFAYGVFHAAGPGHGKAVIAAYLVSNERTVAKAFGMSLAAALLQAAVAIALVLVISLALRGTAATMGRTTAIVELASFAAIAAIGLALVWRKAGKLLDATAPAHRHSGGAHRHDHGSAAHDCCGHSHVPAPQSIERVAGWRDAAGVVAAAGLRPCAGALVLLVFALAQGLFAAGIGATLAMAVGTALTTGAIAALAVFAKGIALRASRSAGAGAAVVTAGIELLAAAFILVLGASLLAGVWATAAGS
jgi:nickel/cobalt transporter (NicO) family protein